MWVASSVQLHSQRLLAPGVTRHSWIMAGSGKKHAVGRHATKTIKLMTIKLTPKIGRIESTIKTV